MKDEGFTLVELLMALLIFGMLSAGGVALLSFSVRSQAMTGERLDDLAAVRRLGAIMASDLAQVAPRIVRDQSGVAQAAFRGSSGVGSIPPLAFVRRGWENMDGAARPSLQKVEYLVSGDQLQRRGYRYLDGAEGEAPATLLTGVAGLRLRYRDAKGEWRERWDSRDPTEIPAAVELVLELREGGSIRQLFLTGSQA